MSGTVENTYDTGVRATVIGMVEKCPSGRLANVIDGEAIGPSLPVEIGVVPDGPLRVTGGVRVSLEGGKPRWT